METIDIVQTRKNHSTHHPQLTLSSLQSPRTHFRPHLSTQIIHNALHPPLFLTTQRARSIFPVRYRGVLNKLRTNVQLRNSNVSTNYVEINKTDPDCLPLRPNTPSLPSHDTKSDADTQRNQQHPHCITQTQSGRLSHADYPMDRLMLSRCNSTQHEP